MVAVLYDWDPAEDNVAAEYDTAGNVQAEYFTEPYLYGDIKGQRQDGQSNYFYSDGLGSTTEVTDESNTVLATRAYSAFGETTESMGALEFPYQWIGRKGYYDANDDSYYIRDRSYSRTHGRWSSFDKLILAKTLVSLAVARHYVYVINRVTGFSDPSGLNEENECRSCNQQKRIFSDPLTFGPTPGLLGCIKKQGCSITVDCVCCRPKKGDFPFSTLGCTWLDVEDKIHVSLCCELGDAGFGFTGVFEHELYHAAILCVQSKSKRPLWFSDNPCHNCIAHELIAYACSGQGCKDRLDCMNKITGSCVSRLEFDPKDLLPVEDPRRRWPEDPLEQPRSPCYRSEKEVKPKPIVNQGKRCTAKEYSDFLTSDEFADFFDKFLAKGKDSDICKSFRDKDCTIDEFLIPKPE